MDALLEILQAVLIAVIPVVAGFVVKVLLNKSEQIKGMTNSQLADKYIDEIANAITASVMLVSQTYVDTLKKSQQFTEQNQHEAFLRAYNSVCSMLTKEASNFITTAYGDLKAFLTAHIEAEVKTQAIQKQKNTLQNRLTS